MAQQDEIILDVKVNTDEVRLKMSAALGAVNDYKAAQKELNDTIKQQGYATKEQAASLARIAKGLEENQRAVKSNMAILQAETMARVSSSSSLDDQRQALNAAQKAYAQLSGEAKIAADAEGGLRDQIKALSDSVKAQEAAMGDARRNVGNYNEAVAAAIPQVGTLNRSIQTLNKVTSLTPEALKGMAAGIKSATQAALKFIATPLGATIAAIAVVLKVLSDVFGKLSAAIKKNDDASTALARLYAQTIQPIIDATTKAFAKMAEWVGKAADAMANWLGGATEAGDAAENLVRATDALEEAERRYTVDSAKRSKEVSELRAKALDKEKYSAEERKQLLQQAIDLEKKNLEDEKNIKAEQLRILEETAKRERDTSDETKNRIAEARAAMYQAEQAYYDGTRRLQQQVINAEKEDNAERNRIAEERKRKREEQRKQEEQHAQEVAAFRDELTRRTRTDLENEIADLEAKRDKELEMAELNADERLQIEDYYAAQIQALRDADVASEEEKERAKLEARQKVREEFGLDPEKSPEQQELELLQQAREQDLLNDEEYEAAKTLITQKYSQEREAAIQAEVQEATNLYKQEMRTATSSAAGAMSAMSDLMGAFADESEGAAAAQKAFALGSILINQAMAIAEGAKGIAAAMAGAAAAAAATGPAAPIMLGVYQAQMVGQVLAVVASVASSIVQAKQIFAKSDAGKFANGGVVPGTSYSGDNMIAHVNSGEVIIPNDKAARLYDAISGGNDQQLGFNYELMAAANAALPAPVTVLKELREAEDKVSQFNEIASV